jgi:hypothetical protein
LLARGATYYSDEYAVFDAGGRVHPFARMLQLRSPSAVRHVHAKELGAPIGLKPIDAGLILFAKYTPARSWSVGPLTPGNALLHLLANTVRARTHAVQAIHAFRPAVLRASAYEAVRGDTDAAVQFVSESLNAMREP